MIGAESKDPEDISFTMLQQGVLTLIEVLNPKSRRVLDGSLYLD
jgi:hypothetical protein